MSFLKRLFTAKPITCIECSQEKPAEEYTDRAKGLCNECRAAGGLTCQECRQAKPLEHYTKLFDQRVCDDCTRECRICHQVKIASHTNFPYGAHPLVCVNCVRQCTQCKRKALLTDFLDWPDHTVCNSCNRKCPLCEQQFLRDLTRADRHAMAVGCPACITRIFGDTSPLSDGPNFYQQMPAAIRTLEDFMAWKPPQRAATGAAAMPDPLALANNQAVLGTDDVGQPVTLTPEVRNRHLFIIGKTGSGKSSLLRNLIVQDIVAGHGVAVIDPHGDLVETIAGYVPSNRLADVVYFCPTDAASPAFNLLAFPFPPHKLADDVLSAFQQFFSESWGPRLEHILRHALLTLLADRDRVPHCLADVRRLLTDESYRSELANAATNDALRRFWFDEFTKLPKDAVAPILNKLSAFLSPLSPMEKIFSSTDNALDIPGIMNGGKVLLCNLSKGELGSASHLVGGLIAACVQQTALARATIPEKERRPFFFYVDEFQNYAVSSFGSILSEARKYALNLTIANQTLGQIPGDLLSNIFGNVGVVVALPISAEDAATMKREMSTAAIFTQTAAGPRRYDPREGAHAAAQIWCDVIFPFLARSKRNLDRGSVTGDMGDKVFTSLLTVNAANTMTDLGHRVYNLRVDDLFAAFVDWTTDPLRKSAHPKDLTKEDWPTSRDFLNAEPLHGYVKILKPNDVRALTIHHPTRKPSDHTKRAIIDRQRAEHTAAVAVATVAAAPAAIAAAPPPGDNPDDFWTT